MKKLYIALAMFFALAGMQAQTYNMTTAVNGTTINTCSGTFYDSGGAAAGYGNNQNITLTFCPNQANAVVRLNFTTFTVGAGEVMTFFDGTNTAAGVIGGTSYNNLTGSPTFITASNTNATGCVTVQFTSNNVDNLAGWVATVSCGLPPQPFTGQIVSTVPAQDTAGYVNICAGDQVTFNAGAIFPNNNVNYNQTTANCTYTWDFNDGSPVQTGVGLTTVTHTFTARRGYRVVVTIRDSNGILSSNVIFVKVRVSTVPVLDLLVLPPPLCVGDTAILQAGVTNPNSGVLSTTQGTFSPPSVSGDSIFLPDVPGGTVTCYSTSIQIASFNPGQTLNNINDLLGISMNLEHSYLGDLQISITAPNGTVVVLKAYPGGGGTFLGVPVDNDATPNIAGTGFTYVITPTNNAGTMVAAAPIGGTLPAGNYASQNPLTALLGTPLNGTWTLTFCDNLGSDNGFLFGWAIQFAANIYPTVETYTPQIVTEQWSGSPMIVSTNNNFATIVADTPGIRPITFQVVDNFGCTYDTTVNITVLNPFDPQCLTCDSFIVNVGPGSTICVGDTAQLTALAPTIGPPTYVFNNNTPTVITRPTAGTPVTTNISIPVSGVLPTNIAAGSIQSVCINASINISAHLTFFLVAPNGQQIELSSGNGGFTANYNNICFSPTATTNITTFVFAAIPPGTYRPEGNWNNLNGAPINGTWTLRIVHTGTSGGQNGTFNNVTLTFNNLLAAQYAWTPAATVLAPTAGTTGAIPTATTNYQVIASNTFGCIDTGTVQVVVVPQLTAPTVTCQSQTPNSITIGWTAVPGATNYLVSANGGAPVSVGNVTSYTLNGLTPGTTVNFSVVGQNTAATGSCAASAAGTVSCTIIACPVVPVNITGITTFCAGTTTTLNAGPGFNSYTWSNTTQNTQTATFSTAGPVSVTVTDSNGCPGSDTVTLSTIAPSVNITAAGPTAFCSGGSVNLTATAGFASYAWTPAANTATITANSGGTYTVTVTDASGCTASASQVVTVFNLPTPTALNSGPVCVGTNAAVTVDAYASYVWTGPNSFASTVQNNIINNVTAANAGTYNVTVTDANGCTGATSTTLVVNALPTPTASNDGAYCPGDLATLSATGGVSYTWTGPNTFSAAVQSPTIAGITLAANGTYTVVATDANNCSASATTTVVVNPAPVPVTSNTGAYCPLDTIQLNSTAAVSYAWSGPNGFASTVQNPQILNATSGMSGTYTVIVTDANGCTGTASTNVLVNPTPTITVTNAGPNCVGTTAQLNATGGVSYSWTGPNGFTSALQNPSIAAVTLADAGVYAVTVTSAAGCTATGSTTLVVNTLPVPTASNDGAYCPGDLATLTATGGASYAWSGPNLFSAAVQSPTITGITLAANGTYTVTATDANNCSATATTTIVVNPAPVPVAGNTGAYCPLDTIQLNSSAAVSYAWSGPNGFASTLQNPQILNAAPGMSGTYTVVVTDANTCTGTASTNVLVNPTPVITVTNAGPNCVGTTAQLNATGGVSYSWTGPNGFVSALQNPTVAAVTLADAGVYAVTVTSAAGCTATGSTTLVVNALPVPTASNDGAYCPGDLATLTATGGVSYAWSGPNLFSAAVQSPTITGITLAANGTYTVTATDANNCSATATTVIVVNPAPVPVAGNTGAYCPLDTIQLNSSAAVAYAWTGPNGFASTIQNPQILNAVPGMSGTYTVIVTDVNGCTGTASTNVLVNPNPTITASNAGPFCINETATISVTGGTSYSWVGPNGFSSTLSTISIPGVALTDGGIYNVTGTDANGCTNTSSTTVVINALPVPTATNTGPYCAGSAIQLNATGGVNYSWTGPNGFTNSNQNPTIAVSTVASAGVYTVIVGDANNCTASATTSVVIDTIPVPVITTATGGTEFCNGTSLTLSATAGFASYTWTNGQTTQNIAVTNSGTYGVQVSSGPGCVGSATITVTELLPVTFQVINTPVSCNGGADGTATVVGLVGGTGAGYTYLWSNGQTGAIANGLAAGSYGVTVTDNLGCTASGSTTISQPALALGLTIVSADATCNGVANGVAIGNPFGGTPGYTFLWSNNETDDTVSTLAANVTYTLTVTDANGCSISQSVVVNEPSAINLLMILDDSVSCAGGNDGAASVVASGGTPYPNGSYTYQWSNAEITASATALSAGLATVTVTDNLGCTVSRSILIPEPTPLVLSIVSVTPPLCAGTNTGTATVSASGGTPGYSYQWSVAAGNQTGDTANNLPSGICSVTVTDINGCTASISVDVSTTNPLLATVTQLETLDCFGDSTASLNVTATGGTPVYSYLWSNADTTQLTDSLVAGTYTVTVTDASGCVVVVPFTVTSPTELTFTTTVVDVACAGAATGSITVSATGGVMPYRYSRGAGNFTSGSTIPALNAGTYLINVQDANGCVTSDSIEVIEPNPWTMAIVPGDTAIEYGSSIQLDIVQDATNPSFVWTPDTALTCNDCANPIANPLQSIIYYATVIDENGCAQSDTLNLDVYLMRRAYVANLFSPNGDGNNDVLGVQAGFGVERINVFRVYDRWGELVFEVVDGVPNDAATFWDGTFKGRQMNDGVFAWYAEIEYSDGFKESRKGDATLVR